MLLYHPKKTYYASMSRQDGSGLDHPDEITMFAE